ncbi:sugar transferase [Phycisphaerales bacterium AB-hyl4]|uniref:Sugar transferase n=1 Tax=Natronomicrosphaera hydrolytica TaxID=3242702 RepID=A0ABV4U689_9BACT
MPPQPPDVFHTLPNDEPDALGQPVIWGLDAVELHQRFWAARSVQVVHRGTPAPLTRRAELYLLVDSPHLVLFRLQRAINTLLWRRDDLLLIRLHSQRRQTYCERLDTNEQGQFLHFQRIYCQQHTRVARLAITAHRTLAKRWQHADSPMLGWRDLRLAVPHHQRTTISLPGQLKTAHDPHEQQQFIFSLAQQWRRPDRTIPRAKQHTDGVWTDIDTPLHDHVRCVGPVWIGAGQPMQPTTSIVGPAALWDVTNVDADTPTRWRWPTQPGPVFRPLNSTPRPPALGKRITKRAFDIAFALAALLMVLPLFPLIMLAIWLEDGRPFFFAHMRETLGGREFPCLKFRSMRNDAEQIKAQLAAVNQVDGPQFFMENDPRVTKVGRFLRKTHLDELPQLLNVLVGQMSVVGPRPSPHAENQYCPAWREARLSIRPGITGLWQVMRTRREGEDFQEWIRYDLEYVDRMSWSLDIWIIHRTIRHLLGFK